MAMIFLSGLAMSSYFLALCYMLMTFMGISKLCSNKNLSYSRTTQLLMVSVSLGCLFRAATFSTLCFLDFQHTESGLSPLSSPVHVPEVTAPEESDLSFYNKVVAVLFNLPDYLFVSSYLLVVLLWAETYQSSRRHWFSAEQFHRRWMIFYLIFNGLLYLTQVVLYALLFLRADPSAIAGIYENEEGTQLALGWFNVGKNNATTQSMLLVALFMAAEILPIYILIDADLLRLLSMDAAYEQILEP
ncbi:hypothetical protein DYB30_010299 [Aphanomyces astaci]|uniref:THH1/TOM1/TOM3 domain-containing protein n=1 Tax=Aphanomyces astaci TaxID=112090 RepID=A0A397ADA8_APHAT|nr:hypothetical protein DYB36_005176 [Aphanomyces astaci]RHY44252.1 hypothetical protein DYB34_005121 [Aphanomyces astaci]RHY50964.1 hypothetical protein DYB30_010299 [Aphanomyces astaci]RHZ33646.1 hypothetical protein DYB26_011532 [Aphanomyces astaci]